MGYLLRINTVGSVCYFRVTLYLYMVIGQAGRTTSSPVGAMTRQLSSSLLTHAAYLAHRTVNLAPYN